MELVKYNAVRQALIECATIDEAKEIKDKAQALSAYARQVKDNELEKRSVEIRERARIKFGELSLALPKSSGGANPAATLPDAGKSKKEALADAGVSTSEANRAENLAKKSEEAREAHVVKAIEAVEKRNNPTTHVANNSGENEWYTPVEYIEAAACVMGVIDLDPASCPLANVAVMAGEFYSQEDDGLSREWHGSVWMNPPYSRPLVSQFTAKLISEIKAQRVTAAIVLTNNFTDTGSGQDLLSTCSAVCFPGKRIKFIDSEGNASGAPLQGQMITYFGIDPEGFAREFSQFGKVLFSA